jgi:uncharacterized protein
MRTLLLSVTLSAASAASFSAQPTIESVKELLEVTKAEAMIDQAYASVEHFAKQGMAQQTAGRKLTDEQQRAIELAPAKIAEVMKKELSWNTLQPIYIAIYQETFDQAEIDGLIQFYKSPVGQSFVSKMPQVMNRSMQTMQVQMQTLMPKIKEAMDQVMREAKLPPKT